MGEWASCLAYHSPLTNHTVVILSFCELDWRKVDLFLGVEGSVWESGPVFWRNTHN